MKKILYIINVDWFVISHWLPVMKSAKEAGYEIHVATQFTGKEDALKKCGFFVYPLSLKRGELGVFDSLAQISRFRSIIKKISPDIIELITIKPVLLGGIAVKSLKRKSSLVLYVSGLGYTFLSKNLLLRALVTSIYKFILSFSNLIVIVENSDDQKFIQSLNSKARIVVLPGAGVDLEEYGYVPELSSRPVVVMASRLLVDKGVCEFVGAAKILHEKGINADFVMVGSIDSDNPASITNEQIQAWENENIVNFLGVKDNIPKIFSESHVIVLPSYREGFPKVLIEAASCGRAIVTTDVPGCKEAIIPNETGLLVPAQNVSLLAAAIECLVVNDKLRSDMGFKGRKLAEVKYDINKTVGSRMKVYTDLLSL